MTTSWPATDDPEPLDTIADLADAMIVLANSSKRSRPLPSAEELKRRRPSLATTIEEPSLPG